MPRDTSKHWDIGVTGAVVHDGRVLYVQRNYEPNKGTWTLPGGYAEHNETLDEAVRREVREDGRPGLHPAIMAHASALVTGF